MCVDLCGFVCSVAVCFIYKAGRKPFSVMGENVTKGKPDMHEATDVNLHLSLNFLSRLF